MYVWMRLARMALTARSRGPYLPGGESRLAFRCLPSDIDSNIHLNNARYLMLADLGRIDIFIRGGLLKLMRGRRWAPMLGGVQTVFVREIRLWRRFDVVSTIETWDGTQVIGRHRFILEDGSTAALVMTTAGVYDLDARAFIEIDRLMQMLGRDIIPREPTEAEAVFMQSHRQLRDLAKRDVGNTQR